LFTVKSVIKVV